MEYFPKLRLRISKGVNTCFQNQNGVYQDGVLAYCQDQDATIWAIVGHTNLGGISVWHGQELYCLEKQYDAAFQFDLGKAGEAFNGVQYPDGPFARGQIWPCGLWIDPSDHCFYCYFHNETGWGAGDTSYTVFGQQEGEPDYRHIGLMASKDRGKTWDFQGFIITSSFPSFSSYYRPGECTQPGQSDDWICLGSGDFSIYANEQDGFLYLFYTQSFYHCLTKEIRDHIYVARAPIAMQRFPQSWKKLYQGNFSQPGNCGLETPVFSDGAVPSVIYYKPASIYMMSCYHRASWISGNSTLQIAFSNDLIHWEKMIAAGGDRTDLSLPYFTLHCPDRNDCHMEIYMGSNGIDVMKAEVIIERER